jgi:signal transduction histidine kinase
MTPLVNEEGELLSVIAQCRDVTQELESERLKKEFTSTLSHELRTPLTSIIGSLQLLNSGVVGEVDKDMLELTTVAERNAQRLLDMINDILDIEKIESGKFQLNPEMIELDELVRESLVLNRAFGERFGVRFQALGEPVRVTVNADRKRVLQVLTNLLSNGAKFSPEGGAVEVAMAKVDGRVRVEVHDRGPGIPENFRGRIFSRFAQAESALTRKKGGTGLGLAICKRLIELMGGTIGFGDREGGGTTFYFELPIETEAREQKAA